MIEFITMTPSPLQLKGYFFTKVSIEPSKSFDDSESSDVSALDFNFNGVNISTEIGIAVANNQIDDPRDFLVRFNLSIPNLDGTKCPYTIYVGIVGTFTISNKIEKQKRDNIVTVNGASILYGCIREIVSTITSRCIHGLLILPTANFTDHIKPILCTTKENKSIKNKVSPLKKRSAKDI